MTIERRTGDAERPIGVAPAVRQRSPSRHGDHGSISSRSSDLRAAFHVPLQRQRGHLPIPGTGRHGCAPQVATLERRHGAAASPPVVGTHQSRASPAAPAPRAAERKRSPQPWLRAPAHPAAATRASAPRLPHLEMQTFRDLGIGRGPGRSPLGL